MAKALIILPHVFFSSFPVSWSPIPHATFWDHLQNILSAPKSSHQVLLLGKPKLKCKE